MGGPTRPPYPRSDVSEGNSHLLLQSPAESSDRHRRRKTILLQTTSRVAVEPHRHVDGHPELCLAVSFASDSTSNIICPDGSRAKRVNKRCSRTRDSGRCGPGNEPFCFSAGVLETSDPFAQVSR